MTTKQLMEMKNAVLDRMDARLTKCGDEKRAMNDEEITANDADTAEVLRLETTIRAMGDAQQRAAGKKAGDTVEEAEKRAFENMLRHGTEGAEARADTNMTYTNNGAIVPKTIANKIVETVRELCPILQLATVYTAPGELVFPVWGDEASSTNITVAYADEFSTPDAATGKFTSVSMTGYLFSALVKIPRSLINEAVFDVVGFVTRKLAEAWVEWATKELIVGTTNKMTGLLSATSALTAAAAAAVTTDELISLQMSIPQQYQANACWIMHKNTLAAIRKLKDSNGQYVLNPDLTKGFGWELLGKPVYIDENMPEMAATKKPIVYGDMSGLYVKMGEQPTLQVLLELYATQHAIGLDLWGKMDSKIVESQKIRLLTMKAS